MSRPKKNKVAPKLNLASEESRRIIAAFKEQADKPKPVVQQAAKTGPSTRLFNQSRP